MARDNWVKDLAYLVILVTPLKIRVNVIAGRDIVGTKGDRVILRLFWRHVVVMIQAAFELNGERLRVGVVPVFEDRRARAPRLHRDIRLWP